MKILGVFILLVITSAIATLIEGKHGKISRFRRETNDSKGDDKSKTRRGSLEESTDFVIGRLLPTTDLKVLRRSVIGWPRSNHPSIVVANIGKFPFDVEALSGVVSNFYLGIISGAHLWPGEITTIEMPNSYFVTTLRIINPSNKNVLFYAYRNNTPSGFISNHYESKFNISSFGSNWDLLEISKLFVELLVGSDPASFSIKLFMEIFFPKDALEDPWLTIKHQVEAVVKHNQLAVINAILDNDIKPLKVRMHDVVSEVNNSDIRRIYMNLAEDLLGFEEKFIFTAKDIDTKILNYHVLPLLTRVVSMKVAYYTWGIAYANSIDLQNDDIRRLRNFRKTMVNRIINHIDNVTATQLDFIYLNCDPDRLYDETMVVRTYTAVNGREYYSQWNYIIDPERFSKSNNTVMVYSEYFGTSSPRLYMQAIVKFGSPPLTPKMLTSSKRNQLKSLQLFYLWNEKLICGIRLHFENGDSHVLGGISKDSSNLLELNDTKIERMDVGGDGLIEYIVFYLTDGSTYQYGRNFGSHNKSFYLENHYIASLYAANDINFIKHQLANIAVSYQLNNYDYKLNDTGQSDRT